MTWLGATAGRATFNAKMAGDSLTAPQSVSPLESSDFFADVIAGLSGSPRSIPCKYFYDERGAMLFQKICELPEYYITRTEIDILDRNRADIASCLGPNIELIGLGTGAGTKTRILIEALQSPSSLHPGRYFGKAIARIDGSFQENFSRCGDPASQR